MLPFWSVPGAVSADQSKLTFSNIAKPESPAMAGGKGALQRGRDGLILRRPPLGRLS